MLWRLSRLRWISLDSLPEEINTEKGADVMTSNFIYGFQVEYLDSPIGLDCEKPRFHGK